MAIEGNEHGDMMITGDHIGIAQVHARIGALSLSITHGGRPGLMASMAAQCDSYKRTKMGVMEDYVVWFYMLGGSINAQWGSVERALGEVRAAKLRRKCDKIVAERT